MRRFEGSAPSRAASRRRAKPQIEITYCARCRFLARASWIAQELLTTFADELGEVALVPGEGGVFQVRVKSEQGSNASGRRKRPSGAASLVWCRSQEGRFPELAELKRRVRDRVAPGKSLGHSDAGE